MTSAVTKPKKETGDKTTLSREPLQDLGFPALNRMRQEFDELWNKLFHDVPAIWNAERFDLRWSFEIEDQPEAYVIKAEAPGFEAGDFNVELRGDNLVLQARHEEKKKGAKEDESFSSSEFYRSMTLPPFVDTKHIDASYKNGILQVTLPKTAEGKGRKIPVQG